MKNTTAYNEYVWICPHCKRKIHSDLGISEVKDMVFNCFGKPYKVKFPYKHNEVLRLMYVAISDCKQNNYKKLKLVLDKINKMLKMYK